MSAVHFIRPLSHSAIAEAEARLEEAVLAALAAVCDQVADGLLKVVTAAAPIPKDPKKTAAEMLAAAPGGPPGQPFVSVDDLVTIMPAWQEQVDAHLQPLLAEIYYQSGGHIGDQLLTVMGEQTMIPPVSSVFSEEYLAQAANRLDNIGNGVWERAREQLLQGFQNGESIPQLAARVRSAAPLSARAATAAARTEVVSASNAGSIATARASGIEMDKQWLATKDGRTRATHRAADGQKVPMADAFTVGGFPLDFPGDPGGPPSETDNCRCTIIYDIPDAAVPAATEPVAAAPVAEPAAAVEGEAAAVEEAPAAELAARARQDAIDALRPHAAVVEEVQQLVGYQFDPADIRREVASIARRVKLDPAVVDELLAGAADREAMAAAARAYAEAHHLEQIGDVGQITSYDRSLHQSIGAPLNRGDPVEVIRPGHYGTLPDGERVLLNKAKVDEADPIDVAALQQSVRDMAQQVGLSPDMTDELVEQVAQQAEQQAAREAIVPSAVPEPPGVGLLPNRNAPTLDRFVRTPVDEADGVDLFNQYSQGINGTYGRAGLRAEVDDVQEIYAGINSVMGKVYDANGDMVGDFIRNYGRDENGVLFAEHEQLVLNAGVQGTGFASEFNRNLYDWYRRSGIQQVKLFADVDVGGYTWAVHGFEFVDAEAVREFTAQMQRKLAKIRLAAAKSNWGIDQADFDQQVDNFELLVAEAAHRPVSAFEFSQLGRQPGMGKDDMWIGKYMMLGSSWHGVLWL